MINVSRNLNMKNYASKYPQLNRPMG